MTATKIEYVILILLSLGSCNTHKQEIIYYNNDGSNIKSIHTYNKNHLKDGNEIFYFPNGIISAKGFYKDGKKHGLFYEYYNTGKLAARLNFQNDLLIGESILFGKENNISEIQYYDSLGKIIEIKKFNIDGSRNKNIITLPWLEKDSINVGETINFYVRLTNLTDFRYRTGKFLRGSDFSQEKNSDVILLTDTLEIIESNENYYPIRFLAKKQGPSFIKGLIAISLENDSLHIFPVDFPYFVK
jgi:hypothetical protein